MRHSMLSDFAENQGHMSIGSKLISVGDWSIPMSIESVKIGFKNLSKWLKPIIFQTRKLIIWLNTRKRIQLNILHVTVTSLEILYFWLWIRVAQCDWFFIENKQVSYDKSVETQRSVITLESETRQCLEVLSAILIVQKRLNLQQVMITFHDNLYFWLWIGVAHIDWLLLKIDNTVLRNLLKHSAA